MSCENLAMDRRGFLYATAMTAVGIGLAACVPSEPATEPSGATEPPAAAPPEGKPTGVYSEAPDLRQMAEEGSLPPVDERLPENPLVLTPVHAIGKYGGTLRSFARLDFAKYWEENQYGNSPLRWVDDGLGIAPGHCDSWSTNADNTEWIVTMRKGLKWSDGEPCTVDDVLFWWEDLVLNPDHSDNPPDFGSAGGELAQFTKIDDHTLKITYVRPAPLTGARLAMWVNSGIGPRWIAPKHYLSQFHPKYNSEYADYSVLDEKILWRQNPECPTLSPWVCETFDPGAALVWTRNPYYFAVDTEGNQLPYIDKIDVLHVDDPEVQKLMIIGGEVDYADRNQHGMWLKDIAVLKENEASGNYEVRLWDSGDGAGQPYFWNHDHPDEKKRALFRSPLFKQAISHCFDRPTIQRLVYYETGFPTTGTLSSKAIEFNFNDEAKSIFAQWRDAYVEYNPDKAMALLDEAGIQDANGDGWREYPDGSELVVRVDLQSTAPYEAVDVLEIVSKNIEDIGLQVVINQIPPAEFDAQWNAGQLELHTNWSVGDGPNLLVYPSWLVPNEPTRCWPLSGRRLELVGTDKEDTELDKSPWDRTPARFASSERELIGESVLRLQELYLQAIEEPDELKRHHLVWEMVRIHIDDGPYFIGTVANYPTIHIVSKNILNCPTRDELKTGGFTRPWIVPFSAVTNTETYSFK